MTSITISVTITQHIFLRTCESSGALSAASMLAGNVKSLHWVAGCKAHSVQHGLRLVADPDTSADDENGRLRKGEGGG